MSALLTFGTSAPRAIPHRDVNRRRQTPFDALPDAAQALFVAGLRRGIGSGG